MQRELYFDISSEESGGSLYRVTGDGPTPYFYYNHSTYDADQDEVKVFDSRFSDFAAFWTDLTADAAWYYRHPMFVHPEQRAFVRQQLASVDWNVQGDRKWQESHQRQWKKVLTDPGEYYRG